MFAPVALSFLLLLFGAGEAATCPCTVNPSSSDVCIDTSTNNCNFLPKINFNSMQNQINAFKANTDTLPREGFVGVYPNNYCGNQPTNQLPVPVSCASDGSYVKVGGRDENVLICETGHRRGDVCSTEDGCGWSCAGGDNDGMECTIDSDCPPNNGKPSNRGSCDQNVCPKSGTSDSSLYGEFGQLMIYVNDNNCGASQRYWNGCTGSPSGTYFDSYSVPITSSSEAAACRQEIRNICAYYGV